MYCILGERQNIQFISVFVLYKYFAFEIHMCQFLWFVTAKPVVIQDYLMVHIRGNTALLTWNYDDEDTSVTTVLIEQCLSDAICLEHNVTKNTYQMLEVSLSDGDLFVLVIYQDGLEAYRSQPFSPIREDDKISGKYFDLTKIYI